MSFNKQRLPATTPIPGTLFSIVLASLAAPTLLHAEEALGRLFFTPEQRQTLDRQRQTLGPSQAKTLSDPTLTVNGIVTRSNGQRTVWINDTGYTERDFPNESVTAARGATADSHQIRPAGAPAVELRVGETLDVVSGQTISPLNDGRIAREKWSVRDE